jgi:hypothetical protein
MLNLDPDQLKINRVLEKKSALYGTFTPPPK